ncbi:hypothetical protein MPER_10074 [Moniliophthora perniciosa FA553]|nr:hypothetical protein MPER_10074 [Moniliophthora perniciosa FA553]
MPALQEASFSVGKDSRYFIDSHHLSVVADKAPKLRRVMMFTRSGRSGSVDDGQIERMRSGADWIFGHQTQVKWSVHRCPRRLTEAKLWEKRILDGGMDWKI